MLRMQHPKTYIILCLGRKFLAKIIQYPGKQLSHPFYIFIGISYTHWTRMYSKCCKVTAIPKFIAHIFAGFYYIEQSMFIIQFFSALHAIHNALLAFAIIIRFLVIAIFVIVRFHVTFLALAILLSIILIVST